MPPNNVENLLTELGSDTPLTPDDDIMLGFKPSKPLTLDNDEPRQGRFPAKNKDQKEIQTLSNTHSLGSRSSDKSFEELRKLMPSNSSVQVRKAREDGSLSFIGEYTYDVIAPYGSMENYLAQVQRPRIGGGMFHASLRDAASGRTVPAVPIYVEPLDKATEMNTDAVALKLAEMVGTRPTNERVEVQAAPNTLDNLRQTAAFLEEVKKPVGPASGGEIGLLLQFQQNAFDNARQQAQENQKVLDDQKMQLQSTIAALTSKPSVPDPAVSELINRFGRLEQAVSTPPMPVMPPPSPGVAEIIAAIGSALTPLLPVVLPLLTPKPDTSGDTLRLMMEQARISQQNAEAQRREDERSRREEENARREEQRRADDQRRDEQRRAEDQRREDEKIRREEQREEQRRIDDQRREDEKTRREEQREEQRRADEQMKNLIASMAANKPEGFSTKEALEIERRHHQSMLEIIQNQNSGQSPQDSLMEKMQEFAQLKEVVEMINPPSAERGSSGGDSTAVAVAKMLVPLAEGAFKALAPVLAAQQQQRSAPEIRYIQAPATVVSPPHAIVPVQPVQVAPVAPVAPVVAQVSNPPQETAPPEVVAGFQAIKNAQTPEQRVDSAVTMLMGLIHHPELSTVVLEMATAVAKKDQESAVGRMHGFLMYGVERGWISKQDVFLTLQAFLKGWDANRSKLLEQVPFLNMLTADPNETFVDLEGGPKKPKSPKAAAQSEESEVEDDSEEDESESESESESEEDEEDEEGSEDEEIAEDSTEA